MIKKNVQLIFILTNLLFMLACNQKENVDLIVKNGKIYCVDARFSIAESFAVLDGKIIAVGNEKEISKKYHSEEILDAHGKYIYPGFNDAHCHFYGYGLNQLQYADLSGTQNKDEIYSILKEHHKKQNDGWILGRGWDQNDWPSEKFPDKSELDKLFPNTPVFLIRIDGHAAWCNSKALEFAGVSASIKVDGGEVLLNNNEPSGVLIDKALGLVSALIPEPSSNQVQNALLEAQKNCVAVGLTSVTDCGLDKQVILSMGQMQKDKFLKMRINAMLSPTDENIDYFVKGEPIKTDRLNVSTIKLFADGALGSRGALMLEDYSDDPGNKGLQIENREYFEKMCQLAYDNNFQVATHCIGDGANRLMLDIYGDILKGKNNRRWRIEHAQIIHSDDFKKFTEFSIIPSIQATHCTSDMKWAKSRVGEERIKGAYAYQTLLNQLGWLPNGTDFPVEEINPILTFYTSVFRTDKNGKPEGGWQIEDGLTREQALRSMTIWGAKASFEENTKGSIEPGRYADFVVLDKDLMAVTPQEVLNTKVTSTWIAGEKVFEQ